VCIVKGSSWTLYDNNVAVTTLTGNTVQVVRSANYLGQSAYTGGTLFRGSIDEFRVYNVPLTASQVLSLFAFRGTSLSLSNLYVPSSFDSVSGLVGYYTFQVRV